MIGLAATRVAATAAEADAALAGLGAARGLYFAVDGGIPGLHPLQATLVDQPAIELRLLGDGVEVAALNAFGHAVLGQPALAAWAAATQRRASGSAMAQVRAFMQCFERSADVLLLGALPFAAHRLHAGGGAGPLGVLLFPERFFRRDAAGAWERVTLSLPGTRVQHEAPAPAPDRATAAGGGEPQDDLPPGGYAAMVRRALTLLQERPLVSLTLSQSYRRRVAIAPVETFRRLREANPAPASFFFNDGAGECLFGASPDLQLVIQGGAVQALPVCGTVARGAGAVGEAESLRELINEEVDAASLAVCSDALRNDLAPLCEPGSLELLDRRRPMSLATVLHAVDRLHGRLRAGCDVWDAIAATAAPVMVTGTPRGAALAAIAELEPSARGWYGGMVLRVNGAGDALVGTILRAATVRGGVAEVRTGGDLLASSSPEREEQESRLKTRSLWRAFGLEAAPASRVAATAATGRAPRVALLAQGDPFAAALRDRLEGLGFELGVDAPVRVVAGTDRAVAAQRVVAIGDAAFLLLQADGFALEAIAPRHGEVVRCSRANGGGEFIAARYASWRLVDGVTAPWDVWASDDSGSPQLLVQRERRVACFLFRPDSLLSQPAAVELLCEALAWCAG